MAGEKGATQIYHTTPKGNLEKIARAGVIEAKPTWKNTYDEYGQEVTELENRAHYTIDPEHAVLIENALENYSGQEYETGKFEAGEHTAYDDPHFRDFGKYAKEDLPVKFRGIVDTKALKRSILEKARKETT